MRWFGGIAKRLKYPALASVPVSAAMLSRVDSVSPEQPLDEIAQLFTAGRVAQLPVMDRGVALGVVTRDGVAFALQASGPHALVAAAPCRQVVTVAPSDDLGDVLTRLRATPDSVALVVDHGAPVGVLTEEVLVAYAASLRGAA
jgi:predicted transcriptional regulator